MSHRLHPAAVARTSDAARQGRSERDWAAVNDPERARRATAAMLASDSLERGRWIREGFAQVYGAYNRRDWELNTLYMDPDAFVFRPGDLSEGLLDADDEYYGVEGYLEAVELFLESWSDLRIEVVEILAADAERVVVLIRWTGHGRRSGVPLDQLSIHDIGFRGGLVVTQAFWWDTRRAARELGLQPPASRR